MKNMRNHQNKCQQPTNRSVDALLETLYLWHDHARERLCVSVSVDHILLPARNAVERINDSYRGRTAAASRKR